MLSHALLLALGLSSVSAHCARALVRGAGPDIASPQLVPRDDAANFPACSATAAAGNVTAGLIAAKSLATAAANNNDMTLFTSIFGSGCVPHMDTIKGVYKTIAGEALSATASWADEQVLCAPDSATSCKIAAFSTGSLPGPFTTHLCPSTQKSAVYSDCFSLYTGLGATILHERTHSMAPFDPTKPVADGPPSMNGVNCYTADCIGQTANITDQCYNGNIAQAYEMFAIAANCSLAGSPSPPFWLIAQRNGRQEPGHAAPFVLADQGYGANTMLATIKGQASGAKLSLPTSPDSSSESSSQGSTPSDAAMQAASTVAPQSQDSSNHSGGDGTSQTQAAPIDSNGSTSSPSSSNANAQQGPQTPGSGPDPAPPQPLSPLVDSASSVGPSLPSAPTSPDNGGGEQFWGAGDHSAMRHRHWHSRLRAPPDLESSPLPSPPSPLPQRRSVAVRSVSFVA